MLRLVVVLLLAVPLAAQSDPGAASSTGNRPQFRWDLLLRHDQIENIPFAPAPSDRDRERLQIRAGVSWAATPSISLEGRVVYRDDSEGNAAWPLGDGSFKLGPIVPNDHLSFTGRQDNFRPESFEIDRINVRVRPAAGLEVVAGKFQHPFDHTEATWDLDLQPEGVAASYEMGDLNALHARATAGAYFGTQLYGDKSKIFGGQYTLSGSENWPVNFDVSASYFEFTDLEVLGRRNWRQNATIGRGAARRFASDFEIGDVLFRLRSDRWLPMEAHVNVIRNFGAANQGNRDGLDAGVRIGGLTRPGSIRFTYTYQDLDRDAVMTGFNGDEWYLHSWYRGNLYRLAVGLWRDFAVQGTYVEMNHHETNFETTRLMIDLLKRY